MPNNVLFTETECCCICQEELMAKPACMLDCSHIFHTECIINWFRSPRDYPEETGDCPLCRAKPSATRSAYSNIRGRVSVLRQMARKKNCLPKPILLSIQRLRDAEKVVKEKRKELRLFSQKKEIKEMREKGRKLRSNRWKAERKVRLRKYELAQYDPMACINFFS